MILCAVVQTAIVISALKQRVKRKTRNVTKDHAFVTFHIFTFHLPSGARCSHLPKIDLMDLIQLRAAAPVLLPNLLRRQRMQRCCPPMFISWPWLNDSPQPSQIPASLWIRCRRSCSPHGTHQYFQSRSFMRGEWLTSWPHLTQIFFAPTATGADMQMLLYMPLALNFALPG